MRAIGNMGHIIHDDYGFDPLGPSYTLSFAKTNREIAEAATEKSGQMRTVMKERISRIQSLLEKEGADLTLDALKTAVRGARRPVELHHRALREAWVLLFEERLLDRLGFVMQHLSMEPEERTLMLDERTARDLFDPYETLFEEFVAQPQPPPAEPVLAQYLGGAGRTPAIAAVDLPLVEAVQLAERAQRHVL